MLYFLAVRRICPMQIVPSRMASQFPTAASLAIDNELTIQMQWAKFLYHYINLKRTYAAVNQPLFS